MQQETLLRLQRIDSLIRMKNTGTSAQLAKKLGVTERAVHEYIDMMKSTGVTIKFNSYRQSYYYDKESYCTIPFSLQQQGDCSCRLSS